jgi:hypothetical protein
VLFAPVGDLWGRLLTAENGAGNNQIKPICCQTSNLQSRRAGRSLGVRTPKAAFVDEAGAAPDKAGQTGLMAAPPQLGRLSPQVRALPLAGLLGIRLSLPTSEKTVSAQGDRAPVR